jgi:hypothetical protein
MPYIQSFPHTFAVLRAQAIRGPCIQFLSSEETRNYSFIKNLQYPDVFRDEELLQMNSYQLDPTIYTLRYKTEAHQREANEVKFWTLPFYFRIRGERIPLLEFQYRSWLPDDYVAIPIRGNSSEILRSAERIEHERLSEIRREEDRSRDPFLQPYGMNGSDDWDDRESLWDRGEFIGVGPTSRRSRYRTPSPRRTSYYPPPPLTPPPPPEPEVRLVPVERIVTQVQVQIRGQPIPKHIGEILLANARTGTDSCPIAALTFAECEKLAVSSCFHIFEKESLERWMTTSASCPVCRSKIENVVSEPSVDAV